MEGQAGDPDGRLTELPGNGESRHWERRLATNDRLM